MKLLHLTLFLLLFTPCFSHADSMKTAKKYWEKAAGDWKRTHECLDKSRLATIPLNEKISLLEQALDWCLKAYANYDTAMKNVDRDKMNLRACQQAVEATSRLSQEIRETLLKFKQELAFLDEVLPKAKALLERAEERYSLAKVELSKLSSLNNLRGICLKSKSMAWAEGQLLEAIACAEDGLLWMASFSTENDKTLFKEALIRYQAALDFCKKEAEACTYKQKEQKQSLRKQMTSLREECAFFYEEGKEKKAREKELQMIPILRELLECGEPCEEELFYLTESIAKGDRPIDRPSIKDNLSEKKAEVRLGDKSSWELVSNSIDVVTGSFYLEETDLPLPSFFPFTISRHYGSENPLPGLFGFGWKLGLGLELIEEDGKIYAEEADGSVIAYVYQEENERWEVSLDDNPNLWNFSSNPSFNYIKDNTLFSSDGSKRVYEDHRLQAWVDPKGQKFSFFYEDKLLKRIESLKGDVIHFSYNDKGQIEEILAKGSVKVRYSYSQNGDLTKVLLPNGDLISYEYDGSHRLKLVSKPHGVFLENSYDDQGRVVEQHLSLQATSLTYFQGSTLVKDAKGGTTEYRFFENQVYKVPIP